MASLTAWSESPVERHPIAGGVREPARERRPIRDEEREVVEAGVLRHRPGARLLDEHEQLASGRAERGAPLDSLERLEPDRAVVVVERAGEIGRP